MSKNTKMKRSQIQLSDLSCHNMISLFSNSFDYFCLIMPTNARTVIVFLIDDVTLVVNALGHCKVYVRCFVVLKMS